MTEAATFGTAANTDRELWREPHPQGDSYYAPSIHVTAQGGIGINVGGTVIVHPLREWHALAHRTPVSAGAVTEALRPERREAIQNVIHSLRWSAPVGSAKYKRKSLDGEGCEEVARFLEELLALTAAPAESESQKHIVDPLPAVGEPVASMTEAHEALRKVVPSKAVVGANADLVGRMEAIWRRIYRTRDEEGALQVLAEAMNALIASPSTIAVGAEVKPLEWPNDCKRGQRVYSNGLLGGTEQYCIAHYGGSEPDSGVVFRWARGKGPWSEAFFNYQGAIAAAQADYETRIRSALVDGAPK